MKKFIQDPAVQTVLIVVFCITLIVMSSKSRSAMVIHDCGRYKITDVAGRVSYADSVLELKRGGVVYFTAGKTFIATGDVRVAWVDCSGRSKNQIK